MVNAIPLPMILLTAALVVTVVGEPPASVLSGEGAAPELDVTVERGLDAGEAHRYSLALDAGEYLHLIVDQLGIDVVVRVYSPGGELLGERDSPTGAAGEEPLSIIAEQSGRHRLEIRSLKSSAAAGRYAVRIVERRPATAVDRSRVAAEDRVSQATALAGERTSAALSAAAAAYEAALPLWREIADRSQEAATWHALGGVCQLMEDLPKALAAYEEALRLRRALADRRGEAQTLNSLCLLHQNLDQQEAALEHGRQALELFAALDDLTGQANALNNLGLIHQHAGRLAQAMEHYQQALPILERLGNAAGQAVVLNNLGGIHDTWGEWPTALASYQRALPILRAAGRHRAAAQALNNIAVLHQNLGEWQSALDAYGEALALFEAVGDRRREAKALGNRSTIYAQLGEPQRGLADLERALAVHRELGDRGGEASNLYHTGLLLDSLDQQQAALEHFQQALALHRALDHPAEQSASLYAIGKVHLTLGEPTLGRDFLQTALTIARAVGDRKVEANALHQLGEAHRRLGDTAGALARYEEALRQHQALLNRGGEIRALIGLARIERSQGRVEEARRRIEQAVALLESLRIEVISPDLRASFLATGEQVYAFHVEVLMELDRRHPGRGWDAAAFEASERGRARTLLDRLLEAGIDALRSAKPTLLERLRHLRQRLNVEAAQQRRLLAREASADLLEAADARLRASLDELEEIETRIRAAHPQRAGLSSPAPLGSDSIRQLLDRDTLLLAYALGEERSFLWAVSSASIIAFELPPRRTIENAAREVYAQWSILDPGNRVQQEATAAELSRMLLVPAAAELTRQRLLIVPDGALYYVPFAALPLPPRADRPTAGFEPLIVEHEISYLPSASVLAALRQEKAGPGPSRTLAVLADPVYQREDPRLRSAAEPSAAEPLPANLRRSAHRLGVEGFERLRASRWEAEAIRALAPDAFLALDFEASRQALAGTDLGQYRILHFATHAVVDDRYPQLSGIVLSLVDRQGESQDGFLRLHEIYQWELAADLVVLSACQTALGKEVRGEGLMGLARGFLAAGATAVAATLWQVPDRATAELMEHFYAGMLAQHQSPAAALRQAQLRMWRHRRWRHPFYWAAVELQGDGFAMIAAGSPPS